MSRVRQLIVGVGINDWHEPVYKNRKAMKEYVIWTGMLHRCFSEKTKATRPSYVNATCSNDWLVFSNFVKDIREMKGYNELINSGWNLDKDILFKGNKHYSKDTCCLVPRELNIFFVKGDAMRGDTLLGVSKREMVRSNKKFFATAFFKSKHIHLGSFENEIDAHMAYKKKKEELMKLYAEEFKGIVDDKVYDALVNYSVDIDD